MLVSISTTFFYNTGQESQKSVYINKQANNKMFYVLVDVINATNASMSKDLINYVITNNIVSIVYSLYVYNVFNIGSKCLGVLYSISQI